MLFCNNITISPFPKIIKNFLAYEEPGLYEPLQRFPPDPIKVAVIQRLGPVEEMDVILRLLEPRIASYMK